MLFVSCLICCERMLLLDEHEVQEYISSIMDYSFYFGDGKKESVNKSVLDLNMEEVYKVVTSSKFRKSKLSNEVILDIKEKLSSFIQDKKPLQFSVPFGAYKSYKFDLDFMPDWAEVFNVSYLLKYAVEILKIYPYGVRFYYTYSADIMNVVSDIPRDKLTRYSTQFKTILQMFNSITPDVQFELITINSLYKSDADFYSDFLEAFLKFS